MSTARAQRIEELFAAALALEPGARAALLDTATAGDADLRAEVESLLAHHESAADFLAEPLIDSALGRTQPEPLVAALPERIGAYRILRELGAGGMGVVYLAEQEHPRRAVALKVIRPGVATPSALRRFEHEAQALARLQHPCIAQIFEAGTADYGFGPQPYFALEYVRGPRLCDFVESRRLGTRERLALLAQVCDALAHAHQRGVIHRDLKPSNILVDADAGEAQVKVLDFGIARVTDADAYTTSLRTDVGQVVGTLPYMSPEQASGDSRGIDQRSDVYSLGVIGYELLCGRLPLDVVGKPLHEAVRIVQDEEPTPLSRLQPLLRGDVETIFAKALEKDRERRYASASELAADLRRYLSDQPVIARPASRAYVLAKFARRNKAVVGGVAAVFAALTLGLLATLRQAHLAARARDLAAEEAARAKLEGARADQEARRAKAVARFQLEMLARVDPELDGRAVKLADVLDAAAAALPGELAGDAAVEGGVRKMLGESYYALGLLERAERELTAARALLGRALGPEHEESLQACGWLANTLSDLGRRDEALALHEQTYRAMLARWGRKHDETVVAELNLAQEYLAHERVDEALTLARENLELRREVFGARDPRTLNALGVLGQFLGSAGRVAEAEPLLRDAYELGRAIQGEEHVATLTRCAMLANALIELGELDQAEQLYRRALEGGVRALGEAHPEVCAWKHNLAALLERKGDLAAAEALYREVFELHVRALGEQHENTRIVLQGLARVLIGQRRFEQAQPWSSRLLELTQARLGADDRATLDARHDLGFVLAHQGDVAGALPHLRECVERASASPAVEPAALARYREAYGTCLQRLQRYGEAEPELLAALEAQREALGEADPRVDALRARVFDLYVAWGRAEQAARFAKP